MTEPDLPRIDIVELRDRLEKAATELRRLKTIADDYDHPHPSAVHYRNRLAGKIEGVELARSYIEEFLR